MNLTIPIVTKEKFQEILLKFLTKNYTEFTTEELFRDLLKDGFPKLDFESLGKSLEKMFVYLPTMVVDIGESQFCWVVSGNTAILIDKITFYKEK